MFLVNTVHDSVHVELPKEEASLFVQAAAAGMIKDVYKYLKLVYNINFDMPLAVEFKLGAHLGEASSELFPQEKLVRLAGGFPAQAKGSTLSISLEPSEV